MYPTVPSTPNINGARDTSAQKPASAASPSTRSDQALTTTLRNSSTRPRGLSGHGRLTVDGGIHGGAELVGVADRLQPAGCDHVVRIAFPRQHPVDHLAGEGDPD